MALRGGVCDVDGVGEAMVLCEGDVEACVLPGHLSWQCFFVAKQAAGAQDTPVLL